MTAERKAEKSISPVDLKFLLLNEARQIGILLNENLGENTVFIPRSKRREPFKLPRFPFEQKRNIVWNRLQTECGLTKEEAYRAVGIYKEQSKNK